MTYNVMVMMMLTFGLVEGIYLYIFISRILKVFIKDNLLLVRCIAIVASVLIVYFALNIFGITANVVIHLIVISLIVDIVYLIIKKVKGIDPESRGEKIYRLGIIPMALVAVIMIYGKINMHHIVETDYSIITSKDMEDLKVALIADIHYPVSSDGDKIRKTVERIEENEPDILILCGDIVDERSGLEEVQEVFSILGETKTKYGIYYVYGNHDRGDYAQEPDFDHAQLEKAILDSGITILTDSHVEIRDDVTLLGRQDRSYPRKKIDELLSGIDTNDFILLADHQPVEFESNKDAGIDLQVSGHTHGGQMWPTGYLITMFGGNDLRYGYKKIDGFQAIVTSGFAGWGYDIKTGGPAEYVIIDIKSQEEAK